MDYLFKIKSSSSENIYEVTFKFINNLTRINCTCEAGQNKMLCKHRISLLEGDFSSLVDQADTSKVIEVVDKVDPVKVKGLYFEYEKVDKEIRVLEKIRKEKKKQIGLNFANGF